MATYDFRYPAAMESEERMFRDLEVAMTKCGVVGELRRRFLLAVSEGFCNALIHGNQLDPAKTIRIHVDIKKESLGADIIDEGRKGLEKIQRRRSRGELADGGRGIALIGHICDRVEFASNDRGGLKLSILLKRKTMSKEKDTCSH